MGVLLVESALAIGRSTSARYLVLLERELVVVGDLFVHFDLTPRIDHNLLLALDGDYFGIAVGLDK